MKNKTILSGILFFLLAGICRGQNRIVVTPAGEMERAVSGHFAGIEDGKLVTWGGCNFPDIPCADGGQKVFYPKAYGACVTVPGGTVYIGGASPLTPLRGEGERGAQTIISTSEVTLLPSNVKEKSTPSSGGDRGGLSLPKLPKPLDNFAACYEAGRIFVAGGQSNGTPNRDVYALDWPDGKEWMTLCESRRLAEHAQHIGAWGIGAMAPPFPRIGRIEELVKYCEQIAAGAPQLPFYFYHIPAFNGAFLPMLELLKAVDGRIPNFAGIKYTFESLYEYNQCRLYGNGKFDMLHGQDETILPCLAMGGARGGIGGTTNYNGCNLVGIIEAWERGDLESARRLQDYSQQVINVICHFRGNIVGGKRIMKLIGLDLGPNRTPFQNITPEEEARLRQELEEINFFQHCNQF